MLLDVLQDDAHIFAAGILLFACYSDIYHL